MRKLLLLAGVLLTACASTPTADLYASEVILTKLESSAYKYTTFSLCGTEKPGQLCKTKATEVAIRKAEQTAEAALAAAKANVTAGSVADFRVTLNALTAIIPATVNAAMGGN